MTRFFTIADSRFFPGLVAMVNSLRLTGNAGEVVVLDQGLTSEQRSFLESHVTVVRRSPEDLGHPVLAKAYPHLLNAEGTIVLIDSDMIVTDSLSTIISQAEDGKVCAFSNHRTNRDRWFAEWQQIFELPNPPRRQAYRNAGFLCFSTHHWPDLLRTYWEACRKVPPDDIGRRGDSDPMNEADQDALNAILMSVVPREALADLPSEGMAFRNELVRVRVVDEQRLVCELDGRPTTILHYTRGPKAWERGNWKRVRRDAFTVLLPRILFGDDVPIRLDRDAFPLWLQPGVRGSVLLRAIDLGHGAMASLRRRLRTMSR
jgi:hypothetical protein